MFYLHQATSGIIGKRLPPAGLTLVLLVHVSVRQEYVNPNKHYTESGDITHPNSHTGGHILGNSVSEPVIAFSIHTS